MKTPLYLFTLCLAAAAIAFCLLIWVAGWLARPDLSIQVEAYAPETIAAIEKMRDTSFDPANPVVLFREVDYSEGESAEWYPKGESPILAELVKEGRLPPVAERVGEEPVVVEGVEGIGNYGGTWVRAASNPGDTMIISQRMSYSTLVRFSPQGLPLVPHVAKSWEVSPDNREFIFTLRKGLKWSDGHPFTADDIMYWWKYEVLDPVLASASHPIMLVGGECGNIEKIDDLHVKFTFPKPNGLFLSKLATFDGVPMLMSPAHFLSKYHPTLGNDKLIQETMDAYKLPSRNAVYWHVWDRFNPECPRLWPWVYHTYKPNPPQSFVRNPYYYMVDSKGNQLPYVDRVTFEVKSADMIGITAANGELTMQARHIHYQDYTHLMSQRERGGYRVLHWYPADRSTFVISANLNRRVDPDRPETAKKHELLNEKKFRQALSLAINRAAIIKADYNNQTEPAQVAPGPASYFYNEKLYKSFTEYDPDRASQLLDGIGLTQRDYEGRRTFPDGSRMTFYLNYFTPPDSGLVQFVCDDWGAVGVRTIPRLRSRSLYYTEKAGLEHDFNSWIGNGEFIPILEPRLFAPVSGESNFAIAWSQWYLHGGLYGSPEAVGPGRAEPPVGHPLRRAMEVYEATRAASDPAGQKRIFNEVLDIAAENVWTINICTPPPVLAVVKNGFRNVPKTVAAGWQFLSPGNAGIETFFFDDPRDSPGAVAQIKESVATITPKLGIASLVMQNTEQATSPGGERLTAFVRYLLIGIIVLGIMLVGVKHPYIGRRLIIMVPTLLVISVVVFTIIQLPPGDYITARIMELEQSGDAADLQRLEDIRETFYLEDPMHLRYFRWLGLMWFATWDAKDQGLLQGHMGRSMEDNQPVNDVVGDRILLTVVISLGSILFTWATAIPIGIYSAVKQYSLGDYVLTLLGFIGMCVPPFLLALILMYISAEFIGISVSGLFSSEYATQPEWTWGKVVDLLQHIWVPVVILGVGGTAGMVRIMRGNLLDELKKPYVITAMAKGVRPTKLLLKYPVRLALNPFVSGIGVIFPRLISGGAIMAMVLSLPTVGPLMLEALMKEDMFLAGSMLMVLGLLGIFGTLVSDLLLLWVDPRIRLKGGTR